ncbi:MAG: 2-C-methyl-D-erythritol 4-phosphate cytidylyltransferase [Bacteroidaceae bacterium]|nr:2-C-methyl-D-erythritol 4-phosphate cytidylyltransferase [Bacteroidaceae bacterium]
MERYAILVAGGKGLRMGGDIPKQFLPIAGKPMLMRTIEVFCQAYPDIHIILVLPVSQQDYWQQLCQDYHFTIPVQIADGGETRFHSVSNGLKLIPEGTEGIVGVHDGVRPFVSVETIRRCYDEAVEFGAVVPVISVVETVRQLIKDGTSVTVPRDEYKLVQTPQTFRISLLKEAYQQPYTSFFTDDASVVEALGKPVHLVEGNRENIKITTPADIRFVNGLL